MTIIAFISQRGGVRKLTLSQALAVEAKKYKNQGFISWLWQSARN